MQNQIIQKSEAFVQQLFNEKLTVDHVFHDIEHTNSVRHYALLIGKEQSLDDSTLEILDLAALFHDTGYTEAYAGHEAISIRIAEDFLKSINYNTDKIEQIKDCIEATIPSFIPTNNLQSIIKDADLSNLGMETFGALSRKLRHEWKTLCNEDYTDIEWLENNLRFLKAHKFYTQEAKEMWNQKKKQNIKQTKASIKMAKTKLQKSKAPIESSKATQMMFKTALRNHIDLTGIADNKANMMLSINALIITIAMPLLASNIQNNNYLMFPAIILLLTCILSVIFATLATRPIKMRGSINLDKIKNGNTNVFFFGNFYEMPLDKYRIAVKTVMDSEEIMEKSIVNDLYYLGKALGSKYSQLRTCYLIFMIGMTFTVTAFVISFLKAMPN